MNDTYKYDPEDIESLLLHKQFHELYPEEKEFVLRHVASEDEYESLRTTLFLMHDTTHQDHWEEPDPAIKANLLREFAGEEKKGFFIWLNSLFAMPTMPEIVWYRRPAVRYAFASLVVLFGVGGALLMFNNNKQSADIAQVTTQTANETTTTGATTDTIESTTTMLEKPAYAENNLPGVFPPAPAVLTETSEIKTVSPTMNLDVVNDAPQSETTGMEDLATTPQESAKDVAIAKPKAILKEEADHEKLTIRANDETRAEDSEVTFNTKIETTPATTTESIEGFITNTPERNAVTLANVTSTKQPFKKVKLASMSANATQMKDVFDILYTAK
jgi:hypothetical protein